MFSDVWQLTAWVSRNKNQIDQASYESSQTVTCENIPSNPFWQVTLRNLCISGGLGLRAKPTTKYALRKSAGVRLDYAFQRWTSDDWTWTTWTYTDGTRLLQEPVQKVHFVGVSGYYRWW